MRILQALLLASAALCDLASGQTGDFKKLHLAHGISLEIPSHWTILSQSTRNNLQAAGRAMTENAGVEGPRGRKESILAVNASPEPTGAMVRVSVTMPSEYSQADLAAATHADLREIADEMLKGFRKMEPSGGPRVIKIEPARIETWKNRRVLVLHYTRHSNVGPSPWQVTQYKIPLPDRLIELTLSHRESDATVWRPILEKVKRSAHF